MQTLIASAEPERHPRPQIERPSRTCSGGSVVVTLFVDLPVPEASVTLPAYRTITQVGRALREIE
jgi:hypothetical protein